MHTYVIGLFITLSTILTLVEVRPVSKLEQSLVRYRRENPVSYQQTSIINNQPMIGDIWNDIQPVLNDHITSHLSGLSKSGCNRITNDKYILNKGDYVEYCLEKILNQDGKSYSTKTSATLYQIDGSIIPLHQAESNIEIETYNQ